MSSLSRTPATIKELREQLSLLSRSRDNDKIQVLEKEALLRMPSGATLKSQGKVVIIL